MNYIMSIFFRAIPLIMGIICASYGWQILYIGQVAGSDYIIAGHVLIGLSAICIALFCTASVIIRQLIHHVNIADKWGWAMLGYFTGIITLFYGIYLWRTFPNQAPYFVSGNILFGIGLITCCVSTVATASTKFIQIPANSANLKWGEKTEKAFHSWQGNSMIFIPIICAIAGLFRTADLLANESNVPFYVAGHVLLGLSLICASLIALVASVVRQINNHFSQVERWGWSCWVLLMGTINIILGIWVLIVDNNPTMLAPGVVLIGLGLICYSISSKVILLAAVWRQSFSLANRIPIIPVVTTLICLFIAAFLFEASLSQVHYFIPARVMIGLGAVCFTLFSIVSILESGTSGKK